MDRWRDRVAVVTGASEGIGEAIVRKLAASGMKVAALARRQQLLEELERSVNGNSNSRGVVKGYICDVSSNSDVTAAFKSIERDFGPVSVLVNNAGVLKRINLTEIDLDNFDVMLNTNLRGVMNCLKSATESMRLHNISDGHIININSLGGHRIPDMLEFSAYCATKQALTVLSSSLKAQLRKDRSEVRVTSISPGLVKTGATREMLEHVKSLLCLRSEDIAEAAVYALAAPSHVNVSEIIVEPIKSPFQ